MTWQAAPRTEVAQAALAAAEQDRRARPERYVLDAERVAAAAARDGDVTFAHGWREGLEQYLGSAQEDGRLNALGVANTVRTAIGRLRAGDAMARFRAEDPAHACTELAAPPIVITGGWRTGTTFLFRLLATDPRLRAPLPVELAEPTRVAVLDHDARERLIDASEAAHDTLHALNPELRTIHDSGGRLPEECGLAMGTDLRNWAFTSTTRLDTYTRWLADQDQAGGYGAYRQVLEALDDGDGRRWVLKAPPHLAELPHVAGTFPGAVIVVLHRDIVETIASGASLFAVFRSMYSDEVDPVDVGRFQADQTEVWLRRAAAFRSSPAATGATVLDLEYLDLVRDPVATLRRIYIAAGLEVPVDLEAFVAAHDARQPRHAHGAHRYAAGDFGLDAHELRERFAPFAPSPGS